MNIQTTMDGLYITKVRFDYLAEELEAAGHTMAAEEVKREAFQMSERFMQFERVLKNYQVEIAAVQHQEQPRWVGVDRAAGQLAGRCFNGVDR
jgi:hypothetical protein